MSGEVIQEVSCPNCLSPIDVRQHGQHITCAACSSQFVLRGHLCPSCTTYHPETVDFCRNCGESLSRFCRRCQMSNWSGDEYCTKCGSALDIFDLLVLQNKGARYDWMEERSEQVRALREQEEVASQKRTAELQAIEEERQHRVRRQEDQERQKERQLLLLAAGVVALFVFVILVYTLLTL